MHKQYIYVRGTIITALLIPT